MAAACAVAASPPAEARHSGWRPSSARGTAPPEPPSRPRRRSAAGVWRRWSAAAPAPRSEHATRASLRCAAASAPTARPRRSPGRAWPPPTAEVARSTRRRRTHSPARGRRRGRAPPHSQLAVSSTSSHTPPRNGECSRSPRTLHSLKPSTGSIRSGCRHRRNLGRAHRAGTGSRSGERSGRAGGCLDGRPSSGSPRAFWEPGSARP